MEVARLVASPVVLRLSLALLHFLWQGLALAALVALGLLALRRAGPGARYALLLAALLLMLACPVVTFFALPQPAMAPPVPTLALAASAPISLSAETAGPRITRVSPAPSPVAQLRAWVAARLPWLGAFWAMGVIVLSLRLLGGWIGLTSLRGRGTRPLEGDWPARLSQLAARLGVRRTVELLASARVLTPMLIGWLRPAILLPAGAVIGLTPDQLEAIIAHELAHLRRHDYLVNLLQSLAETLLFYHPAVWWLSRRIRLERECCCDDLAVAACGDAMLYARALTALGQLSPPQLAPAATGGPLSVRIRRLLSAPAPGPHRPSWLAGAIALAAVGLLGAFLETPTPAVAARRAAVKKMVAQVASAVELYRAPEVRTAPVPASAPPAKPAGVAPKRVSIDLRNASISDVARALTKASGARIVLDEGLMGKVTVKKKDVTVDAVLDSVCRDKGWSWRKGDRPGVYYLSFKPKTGPDTVGKDPTSLVILHLYKLQSVSPQYVLYLLGLSDDPGPEPYVRDAGRAGGAALTKLMPEGVSEVVAIPAQNALLIRGEIGAVGMFINFLELLDKKPQQIVIEAKSLLLAKGAAIKGERFQGNPLGWTMTGKDLPAILDDLVATSQAEITDAIRIATMNLLPAINTLTTGRSDGSRQPCTLRITPRINGDGTISLYIDVSAPRTDGKPEPTTPVLREAYNVRSGEAFVLGGPEADTILAITATILP